MPGHRQEALATMLFLTSFRKMFRAYGQLLRKRRLLSKVQINTEGQKNHSCCGIEVSEINWICPVEGFVGQRQYSGFAPWSVSNCLWNTSKPTCFAEERGCYVVHHHPSQELQLL